MYHFAIVALLALATLKLVDFVGASVPMMDRYRSLMTFVVGVVAAVVLDYSLFAGWGIAIDNADVGVWFTGLMVAGMTIPWRAVFGYLTHDKAQGDETLGSVHLHRAA